jgi:signal transduction histidine kinase
MMTRRSWFVYGTLLAIWMIVLGWQAAEHLRVRRSARAALIDRAKDISNTLGVLMRSQRFFGVITKERLEFALNELVKPGELHPTSVVLLNATNEEVALAGAPIDLQTKGEPRGGEYWDDQSHTLTLMNLVDLGTNIVMSASELFPTNRPPPRSNGPPPEFPPQNGPPPPDFTNSRTSFDSTNTTSISNLTNVAAASRSTNAPRHRFFSRRRSGGSTESFERPDWMKVEEYESIIQKKGVHGFIIVMSTQYLTPIFNRDLWLRAFIGFLATVSVVGSGLAWRNVTKSSDLQIRLIRASELNSHLKEMNLAAAGLAHETRNPLNIIRGLAQMISKRTDASQEIQVKSRDIVNEADRVAAQLNEFINYSRPREVRRTATNLNSVIAEVVRALNYDIQEKGVQVQTMGDQLFIEADEQLLRQALFNLVLNSIQAVPVKGQIRIHASKQTASEIFIDVLDNGPGVSPEHKVEIFKPYFTTHQKGTGLGLAVVQQIVMAHGWEIEYLPNQPTGAIFRISHIKPVVKS